MSRTPARSDEEGFLQRLHRRKLAARNGEPLPEEPPREEAAQAPPEDLPPEEPLLTDADMPPIDSLDAASDYSGFLSPGVSDALQRAALRRLWQVADLDFIDELDIYASDYTAFEPLGDLVTREMRHRIELEARRQAGEALLADGDEPSRDADSGEQPGTADDTRLAAATNPSEEDSDT